MHSLTYFGKRNAIKSCYKTLRFLTSYKRNYSRHFPTVQVQFERFLPARRSLSRREDGFADSHLLGQARDIHDYSNDFELPTPPHRAASFNRVTRSALAAAKAHNAGLRQNRTATLKSVGKYSDLEAEDISQAPYDAQENEEQAKLEGLEQAEQNETLVEASATPKEASSGPDIDQEVRAVREVVFGAEEFDDYEKIQRDADAELLQRVTSQEREIPYKTISERVVQPYRNYKNHRTRWAEFRQRMIYGNTHF